MPRPAAPALLAALAVVAALPRAWGYCLSSNCDPKNAPAPPCDVLPEGDGCVPLSWKRDCASISVHRGASAQVSFEDARILVNQAFITWEEVRCADGGSPGVRVVDLGEASCGRHEYNKEAANANVLLFHDTGWPHDVGTIALTTVTWDERTFEIIDADIEVNSEHYTFDPEVSGGVDLLGTLVHETGHFFGLNHSLDPEATMAAAYPFEDPYRLRQLSDDDIDGICALYPSRVINPDACNPLPRHGYSPHCVQDQPPPPDCSLTPARADERAAAPAALLAAGILAALLGRRARPRPGNQG